MIINANDIIRGASLDQIIRAYETTVYGGQSDSRATKCPACLAGGSKLKGLKYSHKKNSGKCYQCDKAFNVVSYVAAQHSWDTKDDYPLIVERIAEITGEKPQYDETKSPKNKKAVAKNASGGTNESDSGNSEPKPDTQQPPESKSAKRSRLKKSFRQLQIEASGISEKAQKTMVKEMADGKEKMVEISRFQSGSKDDAWKRVPGDDMIIIYVTLHREIQTFYRKNKKGQTMGRAMEFFRVRNQFPETHLDKYGKPKKYESPMGSGVNLYHPEAIIHRFERRLALDTLHIDEGEKKAEKKTMHDMLSVGIGGIHNMAENDTLHKDFGELIQACRVKNVVFTLDADCFDLPNSFKRVESRAQQFCAAVLNYHKYFYAFTHQGIDLNIFIAWVNPSDTGEKGVDDVLVGRLKDKEELLKKDYSFAMKSTNGHGEYITAINITSYSVQKIRALFYLDSRERFLEHYLDQLRDLESFQYGSTKLKVGDDGKIELAQPLLPEEIFWKALEKTNRTGNRYVMVYRNLNTFLQNKFIGRFQLSRKHEKYTYCFVKAEPDTRTVRTIEYIQIKDYIHDLMLEIGEPDIYEFLRGSRSLGKDIVEEAWHIDPQVPIMKNNAETQHLFFVDSFWQINKQGITVFELKDAPGYIWDNQVRDFSAKPLKEPMFTFSQDQHGNYSVKFSEEGKKCHFLQYLYNASDFHWAERNNKVDPETVKAWDHERAHHLLNKITAFGYGLHSYFNPSIPKAVICMDGRDSSIGESYGRSGKSLFCEGLTEVVNAKIISGKKDDMSRDKYLLADVTENTDIIYWDDVRVNFDFELLLPMLSGVMSVRNMYQHEIVIPKESTPKIFISTNHAIRGNNDSYLDRQHFCVFSDFYNKSHKPIDDFDTLFFIEWEFEQWNLYYNFCAQAIHTYFNYGLIEAPGDYVSRRRDRLEIGEALMEFMVEYLGLDTETPRFDEWIDRQEMYTAFLKNISAKEQNWWKPRAWRDKVIDYCQKNDIVFNPGQVRKDKDGKIVARDGGKYSTLGAEKFKFIRKPADNTDEPEMPEDFNPDSFEDPAF